ncbi:MAG: ABC transporter permease [Chloroflexi bacterium]|nr:ABC transporter permease [Chloroflexota bacterium]
MALFILRRLLLAVPVLFGIMLVTFFLQRAIPGDPCRAVLGERATDAVCDAYFERIGLNEPLPTQFLIYVGNILRGDFGDSLRYGRSISDLLAERLPTTIELSIAAMMFAVLLGIPLGIISAYYRNSAIDVGTMVGANIGVSMPVFWLGLMLAYIFSVVLKDTFLALPPSGRLPAGYEVIPFYVQWNIASDVSSASPLLIFLSRLHLLNAILTLNVDLFVTAARYLILPAAAVGTIPLAIVARMTRSSVLETLSQDYVRTARSKGLNEVFVVLHHAVRNALLPVVTIIGLNFSILISGAVLTETIFGLTGVGRTLLDGITTRDYNLVQGFTIIIASAFVMINLIVDILYGYLDPRIRLS